MSKAIFVPGSAITLYDHGAFWAPWDPAPVTEVGTVAALVDAVRNATQGETIRVLPGTYAMQDTLVAAAPDVTIVGATGNKEDVVIRGRGMDNASYGNAPHGFYCQYTGLRLRDLTVERYYYHGLTFGAGAGGALLENVAMLDMGQQFVKASAFPNAINACQVLNSRFAYTAGRPTTDHDGAGHFYGGMIDVHNGANWIIRGCLFEESAPTEDEIAAVPAGENQYWWSPAVYFWNRSSNTLIERSKFINCGRAAAFGLVQRNSGSPGDTDYDHVGGIMRNNMAVITPGRLGAAQIADADAQFLLWESPGAKFLHNTVLTNGQMGEAVRVRFESAGVEVRNNLADDSIRAMDGASIIEGNNTLNAQSSWFVDAAAGDLRLSATGNSSAGTAPRLNDALTDFYNVSRPATTNRGAHHYG